MPYPKRLFLFAGLVVLASGLLGQGPKPSDKDKVDAGPPKLAAAGATPAVGETTLDYEFKNFMSGDGRTSMKEFRGNVVLHDWWGIHCGPCLGIAVPHAYKLDKEHAKDGLVVIIHETQTTTKEDILGFVTQNFGHYGPSTLFLTHSESGPFPSGVSTIPHAALIGVDGKLLMIGNPCGWGKPFEETLKAELAKVKDGWGKSPEAKKARALMHGKGKLAEAAAVIAAADGKIKDDAKDDFAEAKSELEAKYAGQKNAVKVLMDQGRFVDAKAAAAKLQQVVKGKPEWEAEVAPLLADFAKPEVDKEVNLDKALAAITKSIGDKRPTDDHEKRFKDFAKKNEGTKIGAHAAELAAACSWKDPAIKDTKDKDAKDKGKDDAKKPDPGAKDAPKGQ